MVCTDLSGLWVCQVQLDVPGLLVPHRNPLHIHHEQFPIAFFESVMAEALRKVTSHFQLRYNGGGDACGVQYPLEHTWRILSLMPKFGFRWLQKLQEILKSEIISV